MQFSVPLCVILSSGDKLLTGLFIRIFEREDFKVVLMCVKYQGYGVVEKETNLCDSLCIQLLNSCEKWELNYL